MNDTPTPNDDDHEDDDLTPEQIRIIQSIADKRAYTGPIISRRSLLDSAENYGESQQEPRK